MNYNNIKISVVIPLYNHERYIAETIKSVQNQILPVFEVVVIDDGSTDDSGEIVKEIAKNDKKIQYLYRKNSGAHNAINKGIELAKGDFIAILNSDDIYHEKRFEKIVNYLKETNVICTPKSGHDIDEKNTKANEIIDGLWELKI